MTSSTKSRINAQQDRQSTQELLQIYGSLLTPKQLVMSLGYIVDEKSFSQIAREQGVSRQAVHEAVRGVQRLLRHYEEKLQLKRPSRSPAATADSAAGSEEPRSASVGAAIKLLESLRGRLVRKAIIRSPAWIVEELGQTVSVLEKSSASSSGSAAAGKIAGRKAGARASKRQ